ncbi:MAG: exo-alpha-sialidase [Clostridia bacterium]|nr:exo-alpha-sialidase [Clostridia bacterium]
MVKYDIFPGDTPNGGIMFVDHSLNGRSGHLSHALCEYAPGKVIAFYSNCSGNRNKWSPGHNGFGWLEYRRSLDYGESWDEAKIFKYSMDCFLNEPYTISCEKAVSPVENVIISFCIRNENPNGWEPYLEPVMLRSEDGGESWSDAQVICEDKGRIYDAFVHNGDIYMLLLANDDFLISKHEHRYKIYKSSDCGKTFEFLSELPGEYNHRAYGSVVVRPDGAFVCYAYNQDDEFNLDYWISYDDGASWRERGKSFCAKRIRNPQVARVRGGYILHGRSGCMGKTLPMDFVLYTSENGIDWDEGRIICSESCGTAYYSNNLVMEMPDGSQRVLIQSSIPYDRGRVNVAHWLLRIE